MSGDKAKVDKYVENARWHVLNMERLLRVIENGRFPALRGVNIAELLASDDPEGYVMGFRNYGAKRAALLVEAFDSEPIPEFKKEAEAKEQVTCHM